MTWQIILEILLFAVALSMDAFAVSVTDGLIYSDINKKKSFFIAGVFGVMQGLMPLAGYWIIEGIQYAVGETAGEKASGIMSTIITWIAFGLLLFIGLKMLIQAIIDIKKPSGQKEMKKFSIKEVLIMGVATAIDALTVGISLHSGLSNNATIFLHISIITVITFIISLVGLFLGHWFDKLLKGKFEISSIIGGCILITLAIWTLLSSIL